MGVCQYNAELKIESTTNKQSPKYKKNKAFGTNI
jgi:hypothetical protein